MNEVFHKINEVITDYLFDIGNISINPDTRLGDLPDWDSISAVSIQMMIHEHFQVDLPLELFHNDATFGELITHVRNSDRISQDNLPSSSRQ